MDTKTPKEVQPKGFESIWNPIPGSMGISCCIFDEKYLDCFNEDYPLNYCKRRLVDEIIIFS